MEPLSATASVIAVGSVVVQPADSVKKLRNFWCSIKDAPDNVRAIAADLQVLSSILAEMNLEAQDQNPSMKAALLKCIHGTKPLAAIVEDLEPGFESKNRRTRKWSALKMGFKSERIKRYQTSLDRIKTSLVLAQQSHYGFLILRQLEVQRFPLSQNIQPKSDTHLHSSSRQNIKFSTNLSSKHDHIRALSQEISHIMSAIPKSMQPPGFEKKAVKTFKHIFDALENEASDKDVDIANQQFSLLNKQMAADPTSENKNSQSRDWICHFIDERYNVLKNPFGTTYVRSTVTKLQSRYFHNQYQYEHETSFTVCPAWWLVKVGLTYVPRFTLFSSTIHGWKYALSSLRSVPDNALIFEFCTTGNLSGVQALLARGEASVKDVDSTGKTALHFAAASHDVRICKFLISAGADKDVYEWNGLWTPLLAAADHNNEVIVDVADAIDTIRLFSDSLDFFDHRGSGWSTLLLLLWNLSVSLPDGVSIDDIKRNSLIPWMLRLPASDTKETFRKEICPVLKTLLSLNDEEEEASDLLLALTHQLTDSRRGLGKYIPLQFMVCFTYTINDMNLGLNLLLMKGANLHLASDQFIFSSESETHTSLALYSSFVFVKWRDALLRSSVDLERFVEDEVQQRLFKDTGWNKVSLLALFRCDIQSDYIPSIDCDECSEPVSYFALELSWREWLSRFKEKLNTGNSSNDEYSAYFGGESRFVCLRCCLKYQGCETEVSSPVV